MNYFKILYSHYTSLGLHFDEYILYQYCNFNTREYKKREIRNVCDKKKNQAMLIN